MNQCTRKTMFAMTLFLFCAVASLAIAQQPVTTRYVYDDNGRLRAVVMPTGEAAIYDYDPAGNISAIRRLGVDGFELLSFAPNIGAIGDRVTLYGVGFGVSVNSVTFNGVAAQVVESSPIKVVVIVPNGATTGPITLTTVRGTATTATPFTVKGIGIIPSSARILEGDRLQFTAMVSTSTGDSSVQWSVNGVEGGGAVTGIISPSGLYIAPRLPDSMASATYTVRATSVAEPELRREVEVIVRNLGTVRLVAAGGVSVSLPVPGVTITGFTAVGSGISVGIPVSGVTTTTLAAIGQGVSVGIPVGGSSATTAAVVSPAVAVAVNLPNIASITPVSATRGATVALTINGTNLTGVTTLRFFTLSGALDATITASNLIVASGGNSLTATVTVSSNAALGRRLLVVATSTLPSLALDSTNTTFEIKTP